PLFKLITLSKTFPLLLLLLNVISLSPVVVFLSTHTTYTSPFSVAANCGEKDKRLSLRLSFFLSSKLSPLSLLLLNVISVSPVLLFLSTHTTYTSPFSVAANCGEKEIGFAPVSFFLSSK